MRKNKKKARAFRLGARQRAQALGFDSVGVWDDTVPWTDLVGKYLVDPDHGVRRVKGLHDGHVVFDDGSHFPGWLIDRDWLSLHDSRSQAVRAARQHAAL